MKEETEEQFRVRLQNRLRRAQELLEARGPKSILARELLLIEAAATVYCGAEMLKENAHNVLLYAGICPVCEHQGLANLPAGYKRCTACMEEFS